MRVSAVFVLLFFVVLVDGASPIWKVFCGPALFKGRLDPIVNPGKHSGHTHQVSGGNHFSAASTTQTPMDVYNDMMSSSCTTCSIGTIDLSAYWHPDLYYMWPNGTFSVVPYSGLTVYYLSRQPSTGHYNSSMKNSDVWKPVPKGLRMLAGNPYRRNFTGSLADQAINYACLPASGYLPETNYFPTGNSTCTNGLRAQSFFPMCWDGVNLDSPDHKSHMAYPSGMNTGDCPSTHPVRIPGIFFEAMYSVSSFPHGQGRQPFVWSNGDPTGYGFHSDFLSGWNPDIMAQAISDPTCDLSNDDLAVGNNVKACAPFSQYVQGSQPRGACNMASTITLTEDLGVSHPISALPGCNPITNGPGQATPCSLAPADSVSAGVNVRFLLKSLSNNLYVTTPNDNDFPMTASVGGNFTYFEVWDVMTISSGTALLNEGSLQYASASGSNKAQLFANRGAADTYEAFTLVPQAGQSQPNTVAILSVRTGKYVTVYSNGTLFPTSVNVTGPTELFQLVTPPGGSVGAVPIFNESGNNTVPAPGTPGSPSASTSSRLTGDALNTPTSVASLQTVSALTFGLFVLLAMI